MALRPQSFSPFESTMREFWYKLLYWDICHWHSLPICQKGTLSVSEYSLLCLSCISRSSTIAYFKFKVKNGEVNENFLENIENIKGNGGHVVLELGLQTVHRNEWRLIDRPNNLSSVRKVLTETRKRNISTEVSLIFGLPGQTFDSFKQSVDFCKACMGLRGRVEGQLRNLLFQNLLTFTYFKVDNLPLSYFITKCLLQYVDFGAKGDLENKRRQPMRATLGVESTYDLRLSADAFARDSSSRSESGIRIGRIQRSQFRASGSRSGGNPPRRLLKNFHQGWMAKMAELAQSLDHYNVNTKMKSTLDQTAYVGHH